MSDNTKILIKQYFQSLVDQFITDPAHKDITINFEDYIKSDSSGDTLGNTHWHQHEHITWETVDGIKVPGSERTTYTYKYTISFLNHYQDEERWRGTVCHEFAHLYLFSKGKSDHDHDNEFYSKMDYFEDWLDKHYRLSPRKDKGGDWNQHVDYDKRKQREEQYPSQPRNDDDNYSPSPRYRDTPEWKAKSEELRFCKLISNSETLTELENNWQTIKNSSLYLTGGKEKEWLDTSYSIRKKTFCPNCYNKEREHKSGCLNKCSKCSHSRLWSDSEQCHNENCENYCDNPKWDRKREERKKQILNVDERNEYNRLAKLMKDSKNSTEFEKNYQTVKNTPIYLNSQIVKDFILMTKKTSKPNLMNITIAEKIVFNHQILTTNLVPILLLLLQLGNILSKIMLNE